MLPQTNVNNAYFNTTSLYTRAIFVNEISSPPDFSGLLCHCLNHLVRPYRSVGKSSHFYHAVQYQVSSLVLSDML